MNLACRSSIWMRSRSTMDAVRAVSDKLLQKHRVMPLMKRGKRLFLAVADPTNLHALDEIRFQTSMSIEFVVVEDDKLQAAVNKAIDQAEAVMPSLTDDDFDLENLEVTGGDDDPNADALGPRRCRRRADRAFREQDPARCDQEGRIGHSLRALREDIPHPHTLGRRAQGSRAAAGAARGQDRRPAQGHVAARHRRAPRAAGRPHQDAALQESRHRFSRQHLPDPVRRKGRHPYSRSLERDAGHRRLGVRARAARDLPAISRQAARHDFGDRPDRQRQDRVAVHGTQYSRTRKIATSPPRRIRPKSTCPVSTRSTSTTRWD